MNDLVRIMFPGKRKEEGERGGEERERRGEGRRGKKREGDTIVYHTTQFIHSFLSIES